MLGIPRNLRLGKCDFPPVHAVTRLATMTKAHGSVRRYSSVPMRECVHSVFPGRFLDELLDVHGIGLLKR